MGLGNGQMEKKKVNKDLGDLNDKIGEFDVYNRLPSNN